MFKQKHTKAWFINRVGKEIIRNGQNNLFNPPIMIHSKGQATALFLTQSEKNYTYDEALQICNEMTKH